MRSDAEFVRRAAVMGIAGALITAVGGAVVQAIVQPGTSVSDEMWSYPWSSDALIPVSLLWGLAHVLVAVGIVGVLRSGVAGPTRSGRGGLSAAVVGTVLLLAGELGSIVIREAEADENSAAIVGALFGLGVLLSAVGFLVAGMATLRSGTWGGWRRYTPLITGIWAVALIGVTATKAMPTGIGIYGLCLLALFWALYSEPTPAAIRPEAQPQRA